ncbi:LysR family transcriptional regulator [Conexibacter woesei]|uniref:LysR family transcriptional regulator n=1 Tax=Conexibacter woesei TaxID=191495 RepID=UPI00040AB3F3|nr:LysR family transcriptional regulator [Conexibacter woesei]
MEIRQLRYFVAVAEDQHFRRASARLHVAQPAVSEQIRKLEAELGVRLLDRTSRSVRLTAGGAAFFEDARRILHDVDGAGHSARRAAARGQWRVRLGFTLHALPPVIGTTLARLRTAGARVDVDLATAAARTLLQQVRDGQLDAAVVCLPAATAGLRVNVAAVEPLVAMVPGARGAPDAGPAAFPAIALERLAAGRVLLPRRDIDPACHDATVAAFHGAGVGIEVVESAAETLEQLLLEVLSGAGATLLPQSAAARNSVPGLTAVPLAVAAGGTAPSVPMGIVTRDEAPGPVLARLLDELEQASQSLRARRAAVAAMAEVDLAEAA